MIRRSSPNRFSLWVAIGCGVFAFLSSGFAQEGDARIAGLTSAQKLVPAALGVRTDSKGNSWDIGPDGAIGRVGGTMVNHGLVLVINGEGFVPFQPLMSPDGGEFVLFGMPLASLPGLEVQRRIRLDEVTGILRYVDFFYNGSASGVTVDISLKTNFSGNYQTFLTERGSTEPLLLDNDESSIVVLPGAGQSARAFLFSLAEQGSEVRPSISAQNRYGLTFQYRLELEAGETGALLHSASQVPIPQAFDHRSLSSLFAESDFSSLIGGIEEDWLPYLRNINVSPEFAVDDGKGGVNALGVERGVRDVLAIGSKTRLIGTAESGDVQISGLYGEAIMPLSELAAIVGQNGKTTQVPRLILRDGQIFSGVVNAPGLTFAQTGGGKLQLEVSSLDRLVLGAADQDVSWKESAIGLIETHHGDRLRITDASALKLTGVTPWGQLPISLKNVVWLGQSLGDIAGYEVEMLDGTHCRVFLEGDEVEVETPAFASFALKLNQLKRVFSVNERVADGRKSDSGLKAVVYVKGNQTLVGDIGNTSLPIVSEGVLVETARDDVRRIERLSDKALSAGGMPEDAPLFEIERWDGGVIIGFLRLDVLSLRVGGQNWQIPISDIEKINTPRPLPAPDAVSAIKNIVRLLGARDWATREKATRDLGAYGYLAWPVLQQELAASNDPEVSRRLERVLSGLN